MKQLYTALICPVLEYSHVITYPRYKKSAIVLENVQRRVTNIGTGAEGKRLQRKTEWAEFTIPILSERQRSYDRVLQDMLHDACDTEPILKGEDDTTRIRPLSKV